MGELSSFFHIMAEKSPFKHRMNTANSQEGERILTREKYYKAVEGKNGKLPETTCSKQARIFSFHKLS